MVFNAAMKLPVNQLCAVVIHLKKESDKKKKEIFILKKSLKRKKKITNPKIIGMKTKRLSDEDSEPLLMF